MPPRGLLITGTDTGIGKTRVACWLVRALSKRIARLGAAKPVASGAVSRDGCDVWEDTEALHEALGGRYSRDCITAISLREPLAPPVAARLDPSWAARGLAWTDYALAIDRWQGMCDYLVVEGVGGLLCPITEGHTVADLAQWWGQPTLVVARAGLGTINHTLLTIEAALRRDIPLMGVVLNQSEPGELGLAEETNAIEVRHRIDIPVWGPIPYQTNEVIPDVIEEIAACIESLSGVKGER